MRRLLFWFSIFAGCASTASMGSTPAQWLLQQSQGDGSFKSLVPIATTEQATFEGLETLVGQGISGPEVSNATVYLDTRDRVDTLHLARQILLRELLGASSTGLQSRLLQHQNSDGGFGSLAATQSTVWETSIALRAIDAGTNPSAVSAALAFLRDSQKHSGGWSLDTGDSSVFLTAHALRAIWHHRKFFDVTSQIQASRDFLLGQRSGGQWSEQYLTALSLLAIIPTMEDRASVQPSLDSLSAAQLANGSFSNDVYTTALAARALEAAETPFEDEVRLTGRVLDADTLIPLDNATLSLNGPVSIQQATQSDGRFVFGRLDPGAYQLILSAQGYREITYSTTLNIGDQVAIGDVELSRLSSADSEPDEQPDTGTIRGTVSNADTGEPLPGVTISLNDGSNTVSNSNGVFQFASVDAGRVSVSASIDGYEPATANANLSAGQVLVFSPSLEPIVAEPATLRGTVTNADTGSPLANALVEIEHEDGQTVSAQTDLRGAYVIDEIPVGAFFVRASLDGFDPVVAIAVAESGSRISFSPSLRAADSQEPAPTTVRIRGMVTDTDTGQPLASAQIQYIVLDPDTLEVREHGPLSTDGDAGFEAQVPPGIIGVTASASGYEEKSVFAQAPAGSTVDFNSIQLEAEIVNRLAAFSGRIVDARTGNPVEGAEVSHQRGPSGGSGLSGANGIFSIEDLTPGSRTIRIRLSGYQDVNLGVVLSTGQQLDLGLIRMRPEALGELLPDVFVEDRVVNSVVTAPETLNTSGAVEVVVANVGNAEIEPGLEIFAIYDSNRNNRFDPQVDAVLGRYLHESVIPVDTTVDVVVDIDGQLPFVGAPIVVVADPHRRLVELSDVNNATSTAGACANAQGLTVDLALCMDSSGSVGFSDFDLQLEGTARAIENPEIIPHDGSVRLSVMQFSSFTSVELQPTVITAGNVLEVAERVRSISKHGGGTSIHSCINTAVDQITSASPASSSQVIDVSTDGRSSQSFALAASERAKSFGIDAVNAIGVGSGVDRTLMESIVFPQPVGGDSGFFIQVDGFDEYAGAIAEKIVREVRLPDATIGLLRVLDNGAGNTPSLTARVGNAGLRALPESVVVSFYSGDPANGGQALGHVSAAGVEVGEFLDVRLDGAAGIDPALPLFAIADGQNAVAECNESNNQMSVDVDAQTKLGSITVDPELARYAPGEVAILSGVAKNQGALPADFIARLRIESAAGDLVQQFLPVELGKIPGGGAVPLSTQWDVGQTIAGDYRVIGELLDHMGRVVSAASANFVVVHSDDDGTPLADLRSSTDRPSYRPSDVVAIEHLVRNLTTNAILDDVSLAVEVVSPDGTLLHTQVETIGPVAPGEIRQPRLELPLEDVGEGNYQVRAVLRDGDTPLAADQASFDVARDLGVDIGAVLVVQDAELETGTPQVCHVTFDNRGGDIANLAVRYLLVDLDDNAIRDEQTAVVELGAQSSLADVIEFDSDVLTAGDHLCAVQARIDEAWVDLDADMFAVNASTGIDATLSVSARPRVLALVGLSDAASALGEPAGCVPHQRIELDGDWRAQHFSLGATLQVNVHDPSGRVVDTESASLDQSGNVSADNNAGSAGVNLRILRFSGDDVVVALRPSNPETGFPAPRYQFVATAREGSQLEQLNSGVVFPDCRTQTTHNGSRYQDFLVVPERPGQALDQSFTVQDKSDLLHAELNELGWSGTVVDSISAFADGVRSGHYSAYAMFSASADVPRRTDRELLERVFAGSSVLMAGHINPSAEAVAGAIPVASTAEQAGGLVAQIGADFEMPGQLNLSGLLTVQAASLASGDVQEFARFDVGGDGADSAVARADYGLGQGVFVGLDPLEQALLAGPSAATHWSAFTQSTLKLLIADAPDPYQGEITALEAVASNPSSSTVAGQLELQLPGQSRVIDAGTAIEQGDIWSWLFSLPAQGETVHPFWLTLPDSNGPVEFTLTPVVETAAGPQRQQAERLIVHVQATPSLGELLAQSQSDPALADVSTVLEQASAAQDAGESGGVLRLMLDAAELLADASLVPDTVASTLRRHLAATIARESSRIDLDDSSYHNYRPPSGVASPLFSFELDGDWSANNIVLSADASTATDGATSLAASLNGYSQVKSRPFSPQDEIATTPGLTELRIDVQVPADQTGWVGYLEVVFKMPSEGIYWQRVGSRVDFSALPRGTWQTISYALDTTTAAALQSAGADAQWILAINASSGSSPYLLDNLRVQ